jgi:primosomal protein N' (replication factor Y)
MEDQSKAAAREAAYAYAGIVVSHPARDLDRIYTYSIPSHLRDRVERGCCVLVPFGRRKLQGYVLELATHPPADVPGDIREIVDLVHDIPLLNGPLLRLLPWLCSYYGATTFEALQVLLPRPVRSAAESAYPLPRVRAMVRSCLEGEELRRLMPALAKRSPAQARTLAFLEGSQMWADELARAAGVTASVLKTLRTRGLVEITQIPVRRDPLAGKAPVIPPPIRMNPDQERAVQHVEDLLRARRPAVVLLEGVTGSGKTHVYLECIRRCLDQGRGAVVLVPEIALTPQAVERLRGAVGEDIAILHSALSDGERFDEWWRVRGGRARVVIGTRSAVFAPIDDPGIIIVDEEHEESFKEHERSPRYGARQVAIRRAGWERAVVILGSATPSMESWFWATEKKYSHLILPERIKGRRLARCRLVDIRPPGPARPSSQGSIGKELREAIEIRIQRGEKTILLQNRRGFSSLICRDCGFSPRCPSCAISLTYHRGPSQLHCHYCFHREIAPDTCPRCGGSSIRYQGTGTERIEDEVMALFPGAPVFRMDADTTKARHAHERILSGFAAAAGSILIGTQMIAKGLDIPQVTLAGVVDADLTLNLPDFRAAERTFQLLMQVAGRAGRGAVPGEVIIQTRDPGHPVLCSAARQDFRRFAEEELAQRRSLCYPPFTHLINIVAASKDEDRSRAASESLASHLAGAQGIDVLGPAPCLLSRMRGFFRWHVTLKVPKVPDAMPLMQPVVEPLRRDRELRVLIDVDPVSLF